MDRIETVELLMKKVRQVTETYEKYCSQERVYFEGDRLYMREAHLVLVVGEIGETTMSALAERLGVTPGAISQLAQRIESKGYILRFPPREDRRVNLVRLTERGEAFCRAHRAYDREQHRRAADFLSDYSQEQLEWLIAFEEKLEEMFRIAKEE